jgi:hypothetical protein
MDLHIRNIDDLRSEISRLKDVKQQQEIALGERFSGPGAIFSTVMSLFPKSAATDAFKGQDLVGLLSRIALPFALNKTVFRNSNFLVKTIVGLVSQKASHFISEDSVSGLVDKAKSLLSKIGIGKKENTPSKPKDLQAFGIAQL